MVPQHASPLQQVAAYAADTLGNVFADVTWPAQVVHMCAAQMAAVSGVGCGVSGCVVSSTGNRALMRWCT